MNFIQFLQAVSGDSTHIIMIVFMVMTHARQKARQKALEGQLQRLEHHIRALRQEMHGGGLIKPLSNDLDL